MGHTLKPHEMPCPRKIRIKRIITKCTNVENELCERERESKHRSIGITMVQALQTFVLLASISLLRIHFLAVGIRRNRDSSNYFKLNTLFIRNVDGKNKNVLCVP